MEVKQNIRQYFTHRFIIPAYQRGYKWGVSHKDWDLNAIRSRLARQWDKWLYWWGREDVRMFFYNTSAPMRLLLKAFCKIDGESSIEYTNRKEDVPSVFKQFQNAFLKNAKEAKIRFEQMRKLQKRFEDLFTVCHSYNYLGLSLSVVPNEERMLVISNRFLENRPKKQAETLSYLF